MFVKGLYRRYSLLLFTESKTQNSWDNFWLCLLCTTIHAQLELIPGPLNTGLYKSYTMLMDLGSVVESGLDG